jgi:RND family efflux transporter MFP subunit
MSVWKQLFICLVVLVAAAVAWVFFVPGSGAVLARWGIDWGQAATASTQPGEAGPGQRGGPGGQPGRQAAVVTEPVASATINDSLTSIGTGRANNSVSVRPFSSGRVTEVVVESGQRVAAGDVMVRLDSQTEEIAADRARLGLEDAQARLERIRALRSSNTASAVQLTEAELAVRTAELSLRDAELALARRAVEAPIGGIVGILPVTTGNYVNTDNEIATIDDRSRILVDFWAAERFAAQIEVGMPIEASSLARPGETFSGRVRAVDNRIDAASRTLRVEAEITNAGDRLRAGMSFQVSMKFPGDSYAAVAPLAVQWGTEGAFVWTVRDGLAVRTPVRIVQRNTDSILVDATFQDGDVVVTEGIHAVREGAPVMVARERQVPLPGGQPETSLSATAASGT